MGYESMYIFNVVWVKSVDVITIAKVGQLIIHEENSKEMFNHPF
jgi:hypothetical protein